jgi:hypothetical protein
MTDYFEEEPSVPARVFRSPVRELTNRQPAEDEGAGSKREILIPFLTPAANHLNGLRLRDRRNGNRRLSQLRFEEFESILSRASQHGLAPENPVSLRGVKCKRQTSGSENVLTSLNERRVWTKDRKNSLGSKRGSISAEETHNSRGNLCGPLQESTI